MPCCVSVVICQAKVADTVTAHARAYSYSRPPTLRRFDFTSARPFFSVSRRFARGRRRPGRHAMFAPPQRRRQEHLKAGDRIGAILQLTTRG